MNTDTALTLLLAEQNLKPLIPKQAANSLAHTRQSGQGNPQGAGQEWQQENLG
jgi:hypothetical protein